MFTSYVVYTGLCLDLRYVILDPLSLHSPHRVTS